MSDRHQTKPYPLRMPEELREEVRQAAERNRRSMNAEIVARLEESLREMGRFDPPDDPGEKTTEEMLDMLHREADAAMALYRHTTQRLAAVEYQLYNERRDRERNADEQ